MSNTKWSRIAMLALSIAVLFISAGIANACWCALRPPCEMFGSADAVFIGKVVKVENRSRDEDGEGYWPGDFTFHLRVERSFLAAQTETVEVRSGGDDCAIELQEGESYLVYAFKKKGNLWTSKCSRTKRVANASEDLDFLYSLPKEGSGAKIIGTVLGFEFDHSQEKYRRAGLKGIPVIISRPGFEKKIVTDSEGSYELNGLKAGNYSIEVQLPDYYERDSYWFEDGVRKVEVNDRGCEGDTFVADVKNSVQGKVLSVSGQPLEDVEVTLVPAHKERRKDFDSIYTTRTDKEGKYSLNRIDPGTYLLGINVEEDDGKDNDGFFYPGIGSRLKATIIDFGLGRKLIDYDFRLLPVDNDVK